LFEWIVTFILNTGRAVEMIYISNESKAIDVIQKEVLKNTRVGDKNWLVGFSLDKSRQVFVNTVDVSSIEIGFEQK
jgi:hypothetical protein